MANPSATKAPNAASKGSIGDRVWYDTNGNGIQDAGEQGAANVTVTLAPTVPGQYATYFIQTKTDAQGHYRFDNLDANTYSVSIDMPNGYMATKPNATADDKDSDFVQRTSLDGTLWAGASTSLVTLAAGQSNLTLDAGLVVKQKASLGDLVWDDANGNGVQDSGETGIAGIKMYLVTQGTAATGPNVVATATTDSTGHYKFANLAAGSYAVGYYELPGVGSTQANAGTDDLRDSDFLPNFTAPGNPSVSINPWQQTQWMSLADGQANQSVDLGIRMPDRLKPASLGKLADLLQPSDDLLHTALPTTTAAPVTADAHAPAADGGDALRQLLAAWNAHAALAHAA